jgi:hypothetical protein
MPPFLHSAGAVFIGLAIAALLTRIAYAITDRIAQASWLNLFVSLFTWAPWVAGAVLDGWIGVAGAVIAQMIFLHAFCLVHRALRAIGKKKGRTLTDAQGRVLGPFRHQLCLMVQTPAILVFAQIRLAEILLYPAIAQCA